MCVCVRECVCLGGWVRVGVWVCGCVGVRVCVCACVCVVCVHAAPAPRGKSRSRAARAADRPEWTNAVKGRLWRRLARAAEEERRAWLGSKGQGPPWECRAAQSRQVRPEEAQEPSWGTAQGGSLTMLTDQRAQRRQDLSQLRLGVGVTEGV